MKTRTLVVTAVGAALSFAGCSKQEIAAERPKPVEVAVVKVYEGTKSTRYSAVLKANEQVDLSFRVNGYVQSVAQTRGADNRFRLIDDGDRITRGATLARLHDADYQARLAQAQASFDEAQTLLTKAKFDHERSVRLFESQSITKPEYDAAVANLEASTARLESARGRLHESRVTVADTVIRAPFSGVVLKRSVAPGSLASPGAPAVVVADTSLMRAVFGVSDTFLSRVSLGRELALEADAFPGMDLRGKVTRISAAADPSSRVFEVEVALPNPRNELKVGMIASLAIAEARGDKDALVVPISALVSSTRPNQYAVYVVTEKNGHAVVKLNEIEVGAVYGNQIVVRSGLNLGDRIVSTGPGLLDDGEAVEPVGIARQIARQ
jgi:RND family efflux transporter MFP subunit